MAQHASDLVVTNGRITTLATDGSTPATAEALAVRNGRVEWVGQDTDAGDWIGERTTVLDLGGRSVIPGIIDAHVHFVRAGLTWNDELRWGTVSSLAEGLEQIRQRAASQPEGTWIRVVGGWHPSQFEENRPPTREELDRVAPEHPVLVQYLYEWGMVNAVGHRMVNWDGASDDGVDPSTIDLDDAGNPIGVVRTLPSLRWLQAELPVPELEAQVASTEAASREFLSYGVTGVIDGGGSNTGPDKYDAVYEAWRRNLLGIRVRMTMHASRAGAEEDEFAGYFRFAHARQGDGFLKLLGIGEQILVTTSDDFDRTSQLPAQLDRVTAVLREAARRRWTVQMHMIRPDTLDLVLPIWQEIHREHDIRALRWAIVHGTGLATRHFEVLQEVGAGVITEALLRLCGEDALDYWGAEALEWAPPVRQLQAAGIPVAVGSDALRVASYSPFATLQWLTTGQSVVGTQLWHPDNVLDLDEALALMTADASWFSFEDHERGRLQPGHLADFVALSHHLADLAPSEFTDVRSDLTVVGGELAWASDAFPAID